MNMPRFEVLTAPGRGAVAVIRFAASTAEESERLLSLHFHCLAPGASLKNAAIGRILYGRWNYEDLVVVRTGPAEWEIHCHGGTAAVNSILSDLQSSQVAESAQPASPVAGDCSWQADSSAEVHSASGFQEALESVVRRHLMQAPTRRTAAHLLAQLGIQPDVPGPLVRFLSELIELRDEPLQRAEIEKWFRWRGFAEHLTVPWKILLLGPPNAGKSSLINTLTGIERAIVFDQPGTTRDLLEARTMVQQWPMTFLDSAGVHSHPSDVIEQHGIRATLNAVADCDACLVVLDAADTEHAAEFLKNLNLVISKPAALVLNKGDLLSGDGVPEQTEPVELLTQLAAATVFKGRQPVDASSPGDSASSHSISFAVFVTSTVTGAGLSLVRNWTVSTLIPEEPPLGTPLPLPEIVQLLHRWIGMESNDTRS